MANKFRLTTKQQLILLTPLVILNCILILGCQYILKIELTNKAFLITISVFFLIDALPTLIVHLQYWLKNRGCELIIDTQSKTISFEEPNRKKVYSFDQIKSLHYYNSYASGTGWHSFGQYRFYKIAFNDETEIFVTCLMVNSIEKTIPMLLRIDGEKHLKIVAFLW
ncbi:MAG TPA: hypothetical protein VGE25_08620 [Sediminibacterium sp.]